MGYVPGQSRRTACGRRVLVRVSGAHLDVPLFWQCWKLDSPIVGRITDAVSRRRLQICAGTVSSLSLTGEG
jgi:LysR family transcriptional regulator (chromosome initiation inhibitor)